MTKALRLGVTARDKVSGFVGIIHSKCDFLTGNVQYSLQPPAKDGALPDLIGFDAHQLEVIEGPTVAAIDPPADTGIVLGEKVKDIVSDFTGTAVRRTTFLNGCVYYAVQGEFNAEKGRTVEDFTEWKRLKRVGAGVSKVLADKVEPVEGPKKGPGGPMTRKFAARG